MVSLKDTTSWTSFGRSLSGNFYEDVPPELSVEFVPFYNCFGGMCSNSEFFYTCMPADINSRLLFQK